MDGVISVAANAYPAAFSSMVRYCLAGNFDEARIINNRLLPVYDLLFAENNPAGVKAFLHLHGLLKNQLRLPLVPLSQPIFHNVQKCWEALQNN
jgi:4-hydroxy-tetrahydrodipicolinate synthase